MDAPLNTSVILVITVALWLIWVAPYALGRRGPATVLNAASGAGDASEAFTAAPTHRPYGSMVMEIQKPQEIRMTSSTSRTAQRPSGASSGTGSSTAGVEHSTAAKAPPLKINYGRSAAALIGALALLTAVVGGVLALLGLVPATVPLAAVVVFAGCIVLLRTLAVRARRARINDAFRAAMGANHTAPVPPTAPGPRSTSKDGAAKPSPKADKRAVPVFDGEAGSASAGSRNAPSSDLKPFTAVELRRAALQEAEGKSQSAVVAETDFVPEPPTWEPVELPKPSYVASARAERPAPLPLNLPQAPKASGKTSIKATEAAVVISQCADNAAGEISATPDVGTVAVAASAKSGHGLTNLDDVLQRRRA
ncbi:hypothetical protein IV498_14490 [Paenarthrobacter sp. Z7-10]|uniref:hypothetical protein n=1 Tax=Paenarthrobacter sp. Z7-10 TaxID=2787635 RepID=UPI0022A9372C|nr:hypothetical protein [Paenarthrobacter sp. Z7-10]MCZ2404353.1 hypothetical protein [Paenarthrobacter sp. Z7-10]